MRRRILILVALTTAMLGAATYVRLHRFAGGPLKGSGVGVGEVDMVVGQPRAFTEIFLSNDSGHSLTLDGLKARHVRPGTHVRFWVLHPGRRIIGDGVPFPPVPRVDLRAPKGVVLRGHATDVRIIAEVAPTHSGCVGFDGLLIDYHTTFVRYRRTTREIYAHGATHGLKGCRSAARSSR
jgi:hypothetical protein